MCRRGHRRVWLGGWHAVETGHRQASRVYAEPAASVEHGLGLHFLEKSDRSNLSSTTSSGCGTGGSAETGRRPKIVCSPRWDPNTLPEIDLPISCVRAVSN